MRNELITITDPDSKTSRMLTTLRTNIQFINNNQNLQTILITSALPEEGKSWLSSNLAVSFAQTGKQVLLLDSDMRKGRQFSIFNVLARPGLSNYLSGIMNEEELQDADNIENFIRKTEIKNLYLLPAGDCPPNSVELLTNGRMNQLLTLIKQQFDVIIIDAPAALLGTEATILSKMMDATIIVTAHQETKIDDLDKVQKSIKNVGGNIVGVVINKIEPEQTKRKNKPSYRNTKNTISKSKDANADLYLRGKATILEDRYKSKGNNNDNEEKTDEVLLEQHKDAKTRLSETEELIRKMNERIEEQRRQLNEKKY